MKEGRKPPFLFNFRDLLSSTRRKFNNHVGGITIRLPGISLNVIPDDVEQQVAREILIRLADRRVLNTKECCDCCIKNALDSIQRIRTILVDKEVQLSKATDGPLYLVVEFMLGGIRQFLTFTEKLNEEDSSSGSALIVPDHYRPRRDNREVYFEALELLRSHFYVCLEQVSRISGTNLPKKRNICKAIETGSLEHSKRLEQLINLFHEPSQAVVRDRRRRVGSAFSIVGSGVGEADAIFLAHGANRG